MRQLTEDLFHRYTLCYAILYSAITEESQNEWQSFSMQNKSSHTKKGAINIADTVFLLQNPSTTDKIDTKYRLVATIAQYGIYTRMLLVLISQITGWLLYLYIGHNIYKFASLQYREK